MRGYAAARAARGCIAPETARRARSWLVVVTDPTDPQEMWDAGFTRGYLAGLRDATDIVHDYAEERLVKTRHPNVTEEINAALRVAAARIKQAIT